MDDSGNVTDEAVAKTLERAHEVYATFQQAEPNLRRSVAEGSFRFYHNSNESEIFEEEMGAPLGMEEFLTHMKLSRIYFHSDHIFSVVYRYGDLFDGNVWDTYINADFTLRF